MNKITHQLADEADEFCRDVIQAARASDQEVNAALNAPFLYPRLRARIDAERKTRTSVFLRVGQRWDWARQWRWALTGVTLAALLVLVGWRWWQPAPAAPLIAHEQPVPKRMVEEASALPAPPPKNKIVAKPLLATSTKARRAVRLPVEEEAEIATDYLPLTYVTEGEEHSGQVVRVEMPRSAMLALGFPVDNEATSELVKADVLVGDDGLALAIRFVRKLDKSAD